MKSLINNILFSEEPKPTKDCPRQNGYFVHPDPQVGFEITCYQVSCNILAGCFGSLGVRDFNDLHVNCGF